jgi:hypothetical protein
MNFDLLIEYLKEKIQDDLFLKSIEFEVQQFIKDVKKGHSPLQIEGEGSSYQEFGDLRLMTLLGKYLESQIGEWDLEYILRAIEYEFEEEEEKVEKVIFCFADPFLNYSISPNNIFSALKFLKGESDSMKLDDFPNQDPRKNYRTIFYKKGIT